MTARRRCGGTIAVAVATSKDRLTAGGNCAASSPVRRNEARPAGPDSTSAAWARIRSWSRARTRGGRSAGWAAAAPGSDRSWARLMLSCTCVGCPARSGRQPAPIRRRQGWYRKCIVIRITPCARTSPATGPGRARAAPGVASSAPARRGRAAVRDGGLMVLSCASAGDAFPCFGLGEAGHRSVSRLFLSVERARPYGRRPACLDVIRGPCRCGCAHVRRDELVALLDGRRLPGSPGGGEHRGGHADDHGFGLAHGTVPVVDDQQLVP